MNKIFAVDEWVRKVSPTVARFYATAAARAVGLPLQRVDERLRHLCDAGLLERASEVRCEPCGAIVSIEKEPAHTLQGKDMECGLCGEEFQVDKYNLFPVYLT